jgi:hypothetical protein
MSVNRLKSTRIFGELIVEDLSGNTNANTILNRDLSVTGKITTQKIVSPFNPLVNLSFLSSLPTTAVADSNAGIGWVWNNSGGQGETDLILYGQGGPGGLALFAANNSIAPYMFCKLYPSLIEFAATPTFPTSNTIGAIAATTQYVNNVLGSYLTTANATSTYLSQSSASSIYQTISGMSVYLTGTTASLTYQPITLMGDYVTGIYASATFQTISNMSNYLTTSSAASIYQTISNMSNYITRGGEIPFNTNIAKFTFPSSFPTSAVNNNATGPAFFWNQSGGTGETDMICYGQGSSGGLSIYGGGNFTNPASTLIAKLWAGYIEFYSTPNFPTSNTIGNIGATTSYVDNRFSSYNNIPSNNFTLTSIGSNILYQ